VPEFKSVKCPKCGWRVFDKTADSKGNIKIKCQKCGHVIRVDLALRKIMFRFRKVG